MSGAEYARWRGDLPAQVIIRRICVNTVSIALHRGMDRPDFTAVRCFYRVLERHGLNHWHISVEMVQSPERDFADIEGRTAARCVRRGLAENIVFMIPPNDKPSIILLFIAIILGFALRG